MESDKAGKNRSFEEQATEAISSLRKSQLLQLNRLLAYEAMLVAIVRRMPPQALPGLSEEYSAAMDRIAASLPPDCQRPEVWKEISDSFEELLESHRQKAQRVNSQIPPAG